MQAVLDGIDLNQVSLVVSSSATALGVKKARRWGIPVLILSSPIHWKELHAELSKYQIQKIFLLGFMRIMPADFLELWKQRIFNLHPSLLPLFPGLHAIEKSYQARAEMGVTVHEVIADVDAGRKILQKKIKYKNNHFILPLEPVKTLISLTEQRLVKEVFAHE